MKLLTLALLLLVTSAWSQELKHAPSIEQCRADQRLWWSKLESDKGTDSVRYNELQGWLTEMSDCQSVDPDLKVKYYNTESEATVGQFLRLSHYLDRHGLFGQFLAEDLQGKR